LLAQGASPVISEWLARRRIPAAIDRITGGRTTGKLVVTT
jgi:hypothetical protein